jgi:hypothetical protein
MTIGQIRRLLWFGFFIFALAQWIKALIEFTPLKLAAAISISLSFVSLILLRNSKAIWAAPAFAGAFCAVAGMDFFDARKAIAIPIWIMALFFLSSSVIGTFVAWRQVARSSTLKNYHER